MAAAPNPQVALAYGPPIRLDEARLVADAARAEASQHGWPMVIAIVDSGAHVVLLERLDDAQLGSLAVAQQKAETAARFRRPTRVFEEGLAAGGLRALTMAGVSAIDGGVPLVRAGQVIGAIGVSGMLPSQDAQVASAGARALG